MTDTGRKLRVAVLGSTGSIGTQTLDVIAQHPDMFEAAVLCANRSVDALARQAVGSGAQDVVICDPSCHDALKTSLAGHPVRIHAGMDAVCELVQRDDIDIVVAAMVGFSGLRSTIAALKAGKRVALANKETMVAAGSLVNAVAAQYGGSIIPVDSEHSAIFQCLKGNREEKVVKLHLTASGGPFRLWERSRIATATRHDALKHPNWSMGAKITIDSATMMNKGLEFIEARWLFDIDPARINIVVHPQSVIHSMVEYEDGAVIAQLGSPDMRQAIQYALAYPHRLPLNNRKLDFAAMGSLEFAAPDREKFPCIDIAVNALAKGGTSPTMMNAANEVAVAAFLRDEISFYGIADLINATLDKTPWIADPVLDDIYQADREAAEIAKSLLKK